MDITTVAKATGVPASTLRYYEEKGLITSVGRHGLRRVFRPSVIERLSLIALGQSAGFSLDEVGALLGSDNSPEIDRSELLNKADSLDKTIQQLTAMRDGLRHAAVCSAPKHLDCPRFQRFMKIAAKKVRRKKSA
ncbi:helix-turn-helix domain-containing protein [Aestuariibacter sp. A3R04]|uniref:helix-turn-helix domain-containing protein n=1 Tax=Aestuariibacter sp. A3R04 TaxID=2841571 RepID=UPI001C09F14B|nr:helix-turn-helix domain-containing protein [Aestuariibacter sp. A3R04]MBU3021699.1 helix-turn-helix domain-containing protein [Aestuariibacter sp. A3R04]